MLSAQEIDRWSEFVLDRVAGQGLPATDVAQVLVAAMAAERPAAPALGAVLPLTLAAAGIETLLGGNDAWRASAELWRAAAMLAAEVLAIEAGRGAGPGRAAPTMAELRALLGPGGDAAG